MFVSSLLKLAELLLESEYKENFILITLFLITYFTIQKFFYKETISKEENLNRQKLAEEYLNKYRDEDDEFFYGALSASTQFS